MTWATHCYLSSKPGCLNSPVIAVDAWSPVMKKYRQGKKDINVLEKEHILSCCIGMKP